MTILSGSDRRQPSGRILPPDPQFAEWYERVNSGAKFRLDFNDEIFGVDGEPYLRLKLVLDGQEGHTFGEVALALYSRCVGALLTQPDGDASEDSDHLQVSHGDIIDFLQTGLILDRVPCTPPWGYPGAYPKDFLSRDSFNGTLLIPDYMTVPQAARANALWLFRQIGATDARMSVFDANNGLRCLWYMYQIGREFSEEQYHTIARRVFWTLPRHYAVVVSPMENELFGHPLFPEE